MTTVHPHAQSAAEAAEAAGSQRMFWQMRGTLFAADAPLTNSLLTAAAAAIGVNVPSFQEDLKPPRVREDFLTGIQACPLVKNPALLCGRRTQSGSRLRSQQPIEHAEPRHDAGEMSASRAWCTAL
jgi:hypothetical protein